MASKVNRTPKEGSRLWFSAPAFGSIAASLWPVLRVPPAASSGCRRIRFGGSIRPSSLTVVQITPSAMRSVPPAIRARRLSEQSALLCDQLGQARAPGLGEYCATPRSKPSYRADLGGKSFGNGQFSAGPLFITDKLPVTRTGASAAFRSQAAARLRVKPLCQLSLLPILQ